MHFKLYAKQKRALMSLAQEILYGGSAGSGKSYMMRVLAILLCLEIPNLKVFFFRRMFKELFINHVYSPDGFLVMMNDLIEAGDVVFNKSDQTFTFYNGAQIYLCHAQHEEDIKQYLGAEMHLLLIDEATQFTEKMIRFLRTRVRLGTLEIPDKWKAILPKIIYGTNPGGIGHKYFKKGFVSHGGGHVFKAPVNDGGMTREYIPAKYGDNIIMLRNDPNYADRIRGLGDEKMSKAYLDGIWDTEEGMAFGDLWDADKHVVQTIIVPVEWKIDRSHDYGYSSPGATLYTAESDGTEVVIDDRMWLLPRGSLVIIGEVYIADKDDKGLMLTPAEAALRMKRFEQSNKLSQRVRPGPADPNIFTKERGFASTNDMYKTQGIAFVKGDNRPGSRERGFVKIRQMLLAARIRDHENPWLLVHRGCVNLISQIPDLPTAIDNAQDVDTNANDHIYDALRYRVTKNVNRMSTEAYSGY